VSDNTLDGNRFVPKRLECRVQLGFVSTGNEYASPLIDELPGRGQTHAGDRLGDDHHFPFQFLRHGTLLVPLRAVRVRGDAYVRPPHHTLPTTLRICWFDSR